VVKHVHLILSEGGGVNEIVWPCRTVVGYPLCNHLVVKAEISGSNLRFEITRFVCEYLWGFSVAVDTRHDYRR